MRIKLSYLEVHNGSTIFMKGNLGTKLTPKNKPGIIMERDMNDGSVYIVYNGELLILERTSVFSWMPENPDDVGVPKTLMAAAQPLTKSQIIDMHKAQNEAAIEIAQAVAKRGKSAQVQTPADAAIHLQGANKFKRPDPVEPPGKA